MTEFSSILSTSGVRGAYRSSKELSGLPGPEAATAKGESFSEMLQTATTGAVGKVREAEAVAQKGLTGEIGTQRVVEATLELESTVKVMVSMRDKVVEAYQEIMRMPL
ncbi:flagellar hook-basal body complex protein FliE [Limimaricola cinnabarinus]|jgi:flagellar hook-basal body complex protein FliE|uniref:Flagellar hook-basal body complex protein FliE n=1 Tax=Limimaricola cinnabarinus TaxID=1125964 RepID=A0A2G1MD15_9RHOB|nr:flagellar hook-basal body complex protein FliE [Limimaricola cinnabarinus]PHP26560.1 flagellar biosynthesis protein [Limimaricola cinnabarinus]